MDPISYIYYRLWILKDHQDPGNYYKALAEFGLYESEDGTGVNSATGAFAAASSVVSAASRAIDNKTTTTWESASTGEEDGEWLSVRLAVAKPIRSFKMTGNPDNPAQWLKDFKIEGSADNISWELLYEKKNSSGQILLVNIARTVSGISKLSTGVKSSKVYVHDWQTGDFIGSVVPKTNGSWSCPAGDAEQVLVTHIGPSGYEPKSDGPITPQSW